MGAQFVIIIQKILRFNFSLKIWWCGKVKLFLINQLIENGIYKYKDKQLYELNSDELIKLIKNHKDKKINVSNTIYELIHKECKP
ncbi:Fur-regulated basic protein FbpA [Bacillus cereus]|uniref:Fur-regulated basic protein FbpA n=1 Tax=Bacillus cereus TaxID=1396 RepID=UPI00283A8B30|nr:Fur-regulated basic protein FbpA [Bacillus cereus]